MVRKSLLYKYYPCIAIQRNVHLSFLAKSLESFLQTFATLRLVACKLDFNLFTSFRVFSFAISHFVYAQLTTRRAGHGKTLTLKLRRCLVLQPNLRVNIMANMKSDRQINRLFSACSVTRAMLTSPLPTQQNRNKSLHYANFQI